MNRSSVQFGPDGDRQLSPRLFERWEVLHLDILLLDVTDLLWCVAVTPPDRGCAHLFNKQ